MKSFLAIGREYRGEYKDDKKEGKQFSSGLMVGYMKVLEKTANSKGVYLYENEY